VNFRATDKRAVRGHGWNQSITVQFTIAGNFLALCLKFSPTGEKQIAMWRFFFTHPMKYFQQFSGLSMSPSPLTAGLMLFMIVSLSS